MGGGCFICRVTKAYALLELEKARSRYMPLIGSQMFQPILNFFMNFFERFDVCVETDRFSIFGFA
jgi:hypothetical protein